MKDKLSKLVWDELYWSYCRKWSGMTPTDKYEESLLFQKCIEADPDKTDRITQLSAATQ